MKIYSDQRYQKTDQHVVLLYPFWGCDFEDPALPNVGRYDKYIEAGKSLFEMTSLDEADVAILPSPWEQVRENGEALQAATEFAAMAEAAGKRIVTFFWSDLSKPVPLKNAVIFRTSLYKSRQRPNEFAMPVWSEDFVEKYCQGTLPMHSKGNKPVVGFCGQTDPLDLPAWTRLRNRALRTAIWLRGGEVDRGMDLRAHILRVLSNSPRVTANFLLRDQFMAGATAGPQETRAARFHRFRHEYVDNMVDSDYCVCVRGLGNYSYRFYETLSLGRIPVFVNTDCALPFDDLINYREYCVWIEQKDVAHAAEIVADFHAQLSPQQFIDLQHACRRLWEQYLCPVGFFQNFHHHFDSFTQPDKLK